MHSSPNIHAMPPRAIRVWRAPEPKKLQREWGEQLKGEALEEALRLMLSGKHGHYAVLGMYLSAEQRIVGSNQFEVIVFRSADFVPGQTRQLNDVLFARPPLYVSTLKLLRSINRFTRYRDNKEEVFVLSLLRHQEMRDAVEFIRNERKTKQRIDTEHLVNELRSEVLQLNPPPLLNSIHDIETAEEGYFINRDGVELVVEAHLKGSRIRIKNVPETMPEFKVYVEENIHVLQRHLFWDKSPDNFASERHKLSYQLRCYLEDEIEAKDRGPRDQLKEVASQVSEAGEKAQVAKPSFLSRFTIPFTRAHA